MLDSPVLTIYLPLFPHVHPPRTLLQPRRTRLRSSKTTWIRNGTRCSHGRCPRRSRLRTSFRWRSTIMRRSDERGKQWLRDKGGLVLETRHPHCIAIAFIIVPHLCELRVREKRELLLLLGLCLNWVVWASNCVWAWSACVRVCTCVVFHYGLPSIAVAVIHLIAW